jgi:hypothetical protein
MTVVSLGSHCMLDRVAVTKPWRPLEVMAHAGLLASHSNQVFNEQVAEIFGVASCGDPELAAFAELL